MLYSLRSNSTWHRLWIGPRRKVVWACQTRVGSIERWRRRRRQTTTKTAMSATSGLLVVCWPNLTSRVSVDRTSSVVISVSRYIILHPPKVFTVYAFYLARLFIGTIVAAIVLIVIFFWRKDKFHVAPADSVSLTIDRPLVLETLSQTVSIHRRRQICA